jgi:hypothetical protein
MRCTVPVPIPSDLVTFDNPFASCLPHLPFARARATARSAKCAELSRNGLNPDSLPPLFDQRPGVAYGCGMGRP